MTPEEQKKTYPPFLVKEFEKCREEIRIEEKTGKSIPYHPTKITDFLPLIHCVWKISNEEYQEKFLGKQGQWGDNFMETMETFIGDSEGVLEARDAGRVKMTDKQRDMLKNLYDMIDIFEDDPETPEDLGYGENDAAIVNDPKWHKVREYAKLVYMELTGDKI